MRKVILVLMVLMLAGTGIAVAKSIAVPWYVDNAASGTGLTPPPGLNLSIVYLKNNKATDIVCRIAYFSDTGVDLGPAAPNNTFVVQASSTVGFRPVANDPATAPNGQESATGVLVPDRPRDVDTKKNGSLVIFWEGGERDVQGQLTTWATPVDNSGTYGYAHLLPPGASAT